MIYFIGNKELDYVKIGFTDNVKHRLSNLQTSCPFDITLFHIIKGSKKDEKMLHKLFDNQHIRGEWFKLSGPIQALIDQRNKVFCLRCVLRSLRHG